MAKYIDLCGKTFGAWTVISRAESPLSKWHCRCSCGTERDVLAQALKSGVSTNCGCQRFRGKHGAAAKTATKEMKSTFSAWTSIIGRCENPNNSRYKHYGARGIYVCDRWKRGFINFVEDMGMRPAGKSIDRINNDGPYSPENCRWATSAEQNRNTSRNKFFEFDGRLQCINDWATETGIPAGTIRTRLKRGIPFPVAISAQKLPRHYSKVTK